MPVESLEIPVLHRRACSFRGTLLEGMKGTERGNFPPDVLIICKGRSQGDSSACFPDDHSGLGWSQELHLPGTSHMVRVLPFQAC